jgi:DNA-binding SARP family transcriptional activator
MIWHDGATVEARFLGGYKLTIDGRPAPAWRAGKATALFQYLVAHRERLVSRDWLHETLWPGKRPEGSSSLKVAIHAVRCGIQGTDAVRIESWADGYVLRADSLWTDFEAVEAAVEAGRRAAARSDRAAAAEQFRRAVQSYQGAFLPESDTGWAADRREWLQTQVLQALTWLGELDLAAGDKWAAMKWYRQKLMIDRYAEQAYEALAEIHEELGLPGQALRWRSQLAVVSGDGAY